MDRDTIMDRDVDKNGDMVVDEGGTMSVSVFVTLTLFH